MKLPRPFIRLPLLFDAGVLAAEIDALGEGVWRDHPQKFPGNSMLPLLAVGGDPANESFAGAMAPTPELLRCPYLVQVMASFGATLGRTRLMRLAGQAEVTPHVDQGYYWAERVRVHVPIVTQPTVRFECGAAVINMAAGGVLDLRYLAQPQRDQRRQPEPHPPGRGHGRRGSLLEPGGGRPRA